MRKIGNVASEIDARRFSAYLIASGIAAQADPARDSTFEIWVHSDLQLTQATSELQHFLADSGNSRYDEGVKVATRIEKQERAANKRSRSEIIDARSLWGIFHSAAMGPLTMGLMFICVALYVYDFVAARAIFREALMFTTPQSLAAGNPLHEITHGQLWRLFTPALLHGGPLHLLFNVIWLRQLGGTIENNEGSLNFGLQVLIYGIVGNVLQYWLGGSPLFLGMSGAVYGLFGYIWICAKHDPRRAYVLDRETVILMIAWFFLCFTGWVGPIANYAHAGGLLAGIVWATITVRQIPFTRIRF
ncbi:MAG: rhomboid family intramembrane serine protease [Candidatus Sumerlaeaceae bacterium]